MKIQATLKHVRMRPRKARLVADLVRRRSCAEALSVLQHCPQRAAGPIEKLIRSALANAQEKNSRDQAGLDLDNLYIESIHVDEGARAWRIRPRAMGRATWINKATSHVTVVLEER
jgi:large subunit ribosomal protein L22